MLSSLAHHQQQHHHYHCRQSGRINYEQLAEIILYVEMDGGLERGRECVLQIVCALFYIENHYIIISCLINEGFGIIFYIKLNCIALIRTCMASHAAYILPTMYK